MTFIYHIFTYKEKRRTLRSTSWRREKTLFTKSIKIRIFSRCNRNRWVRVRVRVYMKNPKQSACHFVCWLSAWTFGDSTVWFVFSGIIPSAPCVTMDVYVVLYQVAQCLAFVSNLCIVVNSTAFSLGFCTSGTHTSHKHKYTVKSYRQENKYSYSMAN